MKFLEEYRKKDDEGLRRSAKALANQPEPTAQARYEAVLSVIKERGLPFSHEKVALPVVEEPFDAVIAKKYLWKRKNAMERGIEFTLTLSDIKALLTRKTCYYTGMKLEDNCDSQSPQKRTIERIDGNKGYTKENTVACSHAANSLKNLIFEAPGSSVHLSKKQFLRFAKKMEEQL